MSYLYKKIIIVAKWQITNAKSDRFIINERY